MDEKAKKLVEAIREGLPSDVKLHFEEIDIYLVVKPEGWLGSEGFSKVQAKILEHGGEYVSAEKNSHFRIPLATKEMSLKEWYEEQKRKQEPLPATLTLNLNLQVTTSSQLEEILKVLKKNLTR